MPPKVTPKQRAQEVLTAEKKRRVLELRRDGKTQQAIANELGISQVYAGKLLRAALADVIQEPGEDVIKIELARLDWYHEEAAKILKGYHYLVNSGTVVVHVVTDPDTGEERSVILEDVAPKLKAIDVLTKLAERRSKLLGIDRPVKEKDNTTPEEFASKIVAAVRAIDNMTINGAES